MKPERQLKMHLGIIGVGAVGQAIARRAMAAGHEVTIASRRSAAQLAGLAAELGGATPGTLGDAAALDLVVLAVGWSEVGSVLDQIADWKGRILVDATNPFVSLDPPKLADLEGRSASTIVAAQAKGARVVKAFNSVTMKNFDKGPLDGNGRRVLFISGDHSEANGTVAGLIRDMGYAAIELGGLEIGGRLQQAGGPLAGEDILLVG